jgi:hypothetical protein
MRLPDGQRPALAAEHRNALDRKLERPVEDFHAVMMRYMQVLRIVSRSRLEALGLLALDDRAVFSW